MGKGDKRANGKIKRFKQKRQQSQNLMDFLEEDSFNPDYIEVDRILDCTESVEPETKRVVKHYLVKWKSLPYEDCTWEVEEDVDAIRVDQYLTFCDAPPKNEWKKKIRPKSN